MDDREKLEALERQRCAALMAGDAEALAAMLDDDLVHVHLTGRTDGRDGYLAGFRDKYRFRDVARGPLTIRLFGDAAVMTGPLTQSLDVLETGETMAVRAFTTQVWHRSGDTFLLNTCHNAPLTAH